MTRITSLKPPSSESHFNVLGRPTTALTRPVEIQLVTVVRDPIDREFDAEVAIGEVFRDFKVPWGLELFSDV